MKILHVFRIAIMIVTLAAVVSTIRNLRSGQSNDFFAIFQGAQSPATKTAQAGIGQRTVRYNLCQTRIHALILPDGRKVEEFKQGLTMKWLAYEPAPRELAYLEVEKWLGEYCRFQASPVQMAVNAANFREVLRIEFINGEKQVITSAGGDLYRVGDQAFQSPELTKALADLKRIALFGH